MVAQQVDAVWVWNYTPSNQKAVYARFPARQDRTYTKDYIQAPSELGTLFVTKFPRLSPATPLPLTYEWQPSGSMPGFINFSSDRYHLAWSTRAAGPAPWRLAAQPTALGPETFPGDPTATTAAAADLALADFAASGIEGILIAVKLVGQRDRLHLRAYIVGAPRTLNFADASLLPAAVRALTVGFRKNLAGKSKDFTAPGSQPIFFDPDLNHNAWSLTTSTRSASPSATYAPPAIPLVPTGSAGATTPASTAPPKATSGSTSDDALAESGTFDQAEVASLDEQISNADYSVRDATVTAKTRGSAQRAFAKAVKTNYGFTCAITGISTRQFLVASHIVPWAEDESIRLDPRNGICLSTLVDRAFDSGFLTIDDTSTVHLDLGRLSSDPNLMAALAPYDGKKLSAPATEAPNPEYLRRRLANGVSTN